MKYLRRTAGYTLLDHKINEEILEELHVAGLEENFVHTDAIGSNTFIGWTTTGSINNFQIFIQKEDDEWTTTEETTRRREG
jgi:hypothetical protein